MYFKIRSVPTRASAAEKWRSINPSGTGKEPLEKLAGAGEGKHRSARNTAGKHGIGMGTSHSSTGTGTQWIESIGEVGHEIFD